MEKRKIQVIMVSGQMIPNVLPAVDRQYKPEKIILCTSSEMTHHAEILEKYFSAHQIKTERFDVGDALDYHNLLERFFELRMNLDDVIQNVSVNMTGGTKLMTLAAMDSFNSKEKEAQLFYVQPKRNTIISLRQDDRKAHELNSTLKIEDFFRIHGYKVTSIDRSPVAESKIGFARELFAGYDRFRDALSTLNYFASEAEGKRTLDYLIAGQGISLDNNNALDLLALCSKYGLISYYDDRKISFADPESRRMCQGIWLEYFVHSQLQQMKLQDRAMSIQLESPNGTKNELDGAFLYQNMLYILECKTSRVERSGEGTRIIYKLDSLKGIPGNFTRSLIISFLPFDPYEKLRADELRITCIVGKAIPNLEKNLTKLLNESAKGE